MMGLSLGLGLSLSGTRGVVEEGNNLHASGSATVSFVAESLWEADLTSTSVATPSFVSLVSISANMTSAGAATTSFFTTVDTTAPVLSATLDAANNEIDITLTEINFPVTIRWQVRAVATAAPNEAAMLAGTGGVVAGSYEVASTPDSTVINIGALTDGLEYTLYVMASDPTPNHSAISDTDFTYEAPASVLLTSSGVATVSFAAERIVERIFAPAGVATVTFQATTAAAWMTGLAVIDGGTSAAGDNAAVDGGTASVTTNDLIDCGLAA